MKNYSDLSCSAFAVAAVLFLTTLIGLSQGRDYQFERLNITLPTDRVDVAAVYDGLDSIYVLGGLALSTSTTLDEILVFSIETETIQLAPFRLPAPVRRGGCILDKGGNTIYYFGGFNISNQLTDEIVKINLSTAEAEMVGRLPFTNSPQALWDEGDYVYLLGGRGGVSGRHFIFRYSLSANTIEELGDFLDSNPDATSVWSPIIIPRAFLFGGTYNGNAPRDIIARFTPGNSTSGIDPTVHLLERYLPSSVLHPMVITSKTSYIYIIGGRYNTHRGLIRFNPLTNEVHSSFVRGLPDPDFYAAGAVYASKSKSIYFFGGYTGSSLNEISMIQLGDRDRAEAQFK